MPRRQLFLVPGQSVHLIRRGVDRCAIFRDDDDRRLFLWILEAAARDTQTAVHAFALLDTHYHAVVTPVDAPAVATMMHTVGKNYVQRFNRKYQRIGTLYAGPYTAIAIDSEQYLMTCLRYVDQNAWRAGMVANLADDRWSSYRSHAGLDECDWLVEHELYTSLGSTPQERQAAYRAICGVRLSDEELLTQRNPLATQRSARAYQSADVSALSA